MIEIRDLNVNSVMAKINYRILIVFLCLILSSTVQAQRTSKELYEKWKSVYNAQQKKSNNNNQQSNTTPSKNNSKTNKPTNTVKLLQPVLRTQLHKYNVVAISYELLSNAQRQCKRLMEHGYPAQIYLDSKDYYRVIAGGFDNEREALNLREYILDEYPDSWILLVENGYDERYVQKKSPDNNRVYDVVEQMPQFPGGPSALFEYLSRSIKYPVVAEENGVQGRVILTFVVEQDGSITEVNIVKSVDPSLDAEAKRVVLSMPRWIPGKIDGSPVRVKYTVPVTFRLQ